MEDAEGGLSFDFEGGLDTGPGPGQANQTTASVPAVNSDPSPAPGNAGGTAAAAGPATDSTAPGSAAGAGSNSNAPGGRRSFRQTVCRHWLRSLCMKGDACGFLHQYDKSRMPICRFFRLYGECREQDCVYKHTNEDIKECNMYKLGFCPNGPDCRYRHAKLPGPPPPVEEVLQKIQHLSSYGYGGSNRYYAPRNTGGVQLTEKSQQTQGPNNNSQGVVKATEESGNVQQQQQVQQGQQQISQIQAHNGSQPSQAGRGPIPLPPGVSRYFIVKSCNRENLELSVQQGVWATQRSNEAKLNEAFDSAENVILIFSVNRTRHFQGCAKMTSRIGGAASGGNWKYAHGTAHYGRNFSVKWLKLCELSFQKTRHLRNPYNENLPVKISRDCQELEPSVGEQLAALLYVEPDSELMAVSLAAESKREEEKAKGLDSDNGPEDPDIVPFDDNEEEEEEESEEEEEDSYGPMLGAASQGRGRGRGIMWPQMPIARGARPMPGMRPFPPAMMGGDGFSYGGAAPDSFGMPDLFGMRPFPPYGPRFAGDFTGPASGMMFPGRPAQPGSVFPGGGFGMMMGAGRGPFLGGMGPAGANPGRGGRPVGMPPVLPPAPMPLQNINRPVKRDQKPSINDRNDRYSAGSAHGRSQDIEVEAMHPPGSRVHSEDQFGSENNFRADDTDSEDEAPRRSRHGEGKKKRRGSEVENAANGTDL